MLEHNSAGLCISIAWDRMYLGVTQKGISTEMKHMSSVIELARMEKKLPLAIQKCALMKLAEYHLQVVTQNKQKTSPSLTLAGKSSITKCKNSLGLNSASYMIELFPFHYSISSEKFDNLAWHSRHFFRNY